LILIDFCLFIFSIFLTYIIRNIYLQKDLVARVNERSSHTIPTPYGGGIAIALVWLIGLVYLYFFNGMDVKLFFALLCGFLIAVVSFFDDIYELSAKIRLIAQSLSALGGLWCLGGFTSLHVGFLTIENPVLTNLFAFVLILWYINLYNFLDGINGYVGIEAVFLSFAGMLFFGGAHFEILLFSVLGFLVWNWNRAKIFMGDVGSTLLGYNIAIFTLYYANINAHNFWVWVLLFSPFLFDATYTLLRRAFNHESLMQAHKKHLYQRLTQIGYAHWQVSTGLLILNIVIVGIMLSFSMYLALLIILILLCMIVGFIEYKKAFKEDR
jgi:Fuc2NAc and GlcNAc transferase